MAWASLTKKHPLILLFFQLPYPNQEITRRHREETRCISSHQFTRTMMLKETLLDDEHEDLDLPHGIRLDEAVKRLQVDHRAESSKERYVRLAAQEHRDLLTMVSYTSVVAVCIISSAMSFLASSSWVLELMFALSIVMGPTILYQRRSLSYYRLQREFLGEMWIKKERLQRKNDDLKVKVEILSQKTIELKHSNDKLFKAVARNSKHSSTVLVMDLHKENQEMTNQRKAISEAIALVEITWIIFTSDVNKDHIIGEAELNLLALRIDALVGLDIPFDMEELCNRFRRVRLRSIDNFAATALMLYIDTARQR